MMQTLLEYVNELELYRIMSIDRTFSLVNRTFEKTVHDSSCDRSRSTTAVYHRLISRIDQGSFGTNIFLRDNTRRLLNSMISHVNSNYSTYRVNPCDTFYSWNRLTNKEIDTYQVNSHVPMVTDRVILNSEK
jgi:hypothetical protein